MDLAHDGERLRRQPGRREEECKRARGVPIRRCGVCVSARVQGEGEGEGEGEEGGC